MTRQISVAITLNDNDESNALLQSLMDRFGEEDENSYSVTAMSTGNEFARVQLIEMAIEKIDDKYLVADVIQEILSMINPENIDPEKFFKEFNEE